MPIPSPARTRAGRPRAALRVWMALSGAALLAACASGGEPAGDVRGFGGSGAPGEGPHLERGARALNIFISPSGEPFRAAGAAPYPSAEWFARADADHDGKLTLAEFRADALRAFALFDTDHDGVVDAFEVQHYEQAIAPEILPRIDGLRAGEGMDDSLFKGGGGRGRGGAGRDGHRRITAADRRPEGGSLYGMLAEPEPLTAADTDVSGAVTRSEWLARTDRRFALLDTASRGYLTLAELPKPEAQRLLEQRREREAKRAARERGRAPAAPPS